MADNSFSGIVGSMMKGMEGFLSSKTVVGAGASTKDNKNGGGGGMSGKMTPSAVLVIKNGQIKLVNIKNQDTMTKVLDMIPDLVDRFTAPKEDMPSDEDAIKTAFPDKDEK